MKKNYIIPSTKVVALDMTASLLNQTSEVHVQGTTDDKKPNEAKMWTYDDSDDDYDY